MPTPVCIWRIPGRSSSFHPSPALLALTGCAFGGVQVHPLPHSLDLRRSLAILQYLDVPATCRTPPFRTKTPVVAPEHAPAVLPSGRLRRGSCGTSGRAPRGSTGWRPPGACRIRAPWSTPHGRQSADVACRSPPRTIRTGHGRGTLARSESGPASLSDTWIAFQVLSALPCLPLGRVLLPRSFTLGLQGARFTAEPYSAHRLDPHNCGAVHAADRERAGWRLARRRATVGAELPGLPRALSFCYKRATVVAWPRVRRRPAQAVGGA